MTIVFSYRKYLIPCFLWPWPFIDRIFHSVNTCWFHMYIYMHWWMCQSRINIGYFLCRFNLSSIILFSWILSRVILMLSMASVSHQMAEVWQQVLCIYFCRSLSMELVKTTASYCCVQMSCIIFWCDLRFGMLPIMKYLWEVESIL